MENTTEELSRVLITDNANTVAEKIFRHFEINQSCKVLGVLTDTGRIVEKGRAVLDRIEWLDMTENTYNGKRKRIKLPETVGGFVAQKIFRYKRTIWENQIRYTIWRIQ